MFFSFLLKCKYNKRETKTERKKTMKNEVKITEYDRSESNDEVIYKIEKGLNIYLAEITISTGRLYILRDFIRYEMDEENEILVGELEYNKIRRILIEKGLVKEADVWKKKEKITEEKAEEKITEEKEISKPIKTFRVDPIQYEKGIKWKIVRTNHPSQGEVELAEVYDRGAAQTFIEALEHIGLTKE